jgi:CubicO group peptidase (beta-lactamase class C family)
MNASPEQRDKILRDVIAHARASAGLAGVAVAVAVGNAPVTTIVSGTDEQGNPLTPDSLLPLASVTKLAVALAILRLAEQESLSVDDPLALSVPDAVAAQAGVTLRQLLTHTAGLPGFSADAWVYDAQLSWPRLAQACLQVAPTIPPGTRVIYRDIHYGLLGLAIERVTNRRLPDAINDLVVQPLEIEAYLGTEPPRPPATIVDPADEHAGTTLETWNTPFWRSLGAPWDGMVATPAATLGLLRAYLGVPARFLQPATRSRATSDQTGGVGGGFAWQEWDHCPWGLGPMIIAGQMQHWLLPAAPAGTLCHGGYSGCAVFMVPAHGVTWSIHRTQSAATGWFSMALPPISDAVLAVVEGLKRSAFDQ